MYSRNVTEATRSQWQCFGSRELAAVVGVGGSAGGALVLGLLCVSESLGARSLACRFGGGCIKAAASGRRPRWGRRAGSGGGPGLRPPSACAPPPRPDRPERPQRSRGPSPSRTSPTCSPRTSTRTIRGRTVRAFALLHFYYFTILPFYYFALLQFYACF